MKDINDYFFMFIEREMILKISENSFLGIVFFLSNVLDLDVGSNNVENYKISFNFYF